MHRQDVACLRLSLRRHESTDLNVFVIWRRRRRSAKPLETSARFTSRWIEKERERRIQLQGPPSPEYKWKRKNGSKNKIKRISALRTFSQTLIHFPCSYRLLLPCSLWERGHIRQPSPFTHSYIHWERGNLDGAWETLNLIENFNLHFGKVWPQSLEMGPTKGRLDSPAYTLI